MAWSARVQNGVASQASSLYEKLNITDNMPSIRTASKVALSGLAAAQQVLGFMQSPVARDGLLLGRASASCSTTGQLSCQNTTAQSNLCCFNAPGGALLQTQFWDTDPVVGPSNSWTIHGLWPDNCDGTYEANCDDSRAYTNITQILNAAGKQDLVNYMNTYWQSNSGSAETFWEHGKSLTIKIYRLKANPCHRMGQARYLHLNPGPRLLHQLPANRRSSRLLPEGRRPLQGSPNLRLALS